MSKASALCVEKQWKVVGTVHNRVQNMCDRGWHWCPKVERSAMSTGRWTGGQAWWMGKHGKKVAWQWGMVMVGYIKIGNRSRNLCRVVMWHLRGVEGYGRWVEQGTEGEFCKEGEVTQVGKRRHHDDEGIVFLSPHIQDPWPV